MGEDVLMEQNATGMDHNAFTSHRAFVNLKIATLRHILTMASVYKYLGLFRKPLEDDTRTAYLNQRWRLFR